MNTARVGATEIEQVRTATRVFSSWDFTYGGGLAREAVMGQLRWSAGLLDATCPARLRPELLSAVGDLAHRAGFMAFDVGAYEDARRVLRFALVCAEKAADWDLQAYVLDSMALQAMWIGRPDEGLTLTEHALVRADRLTETVQAMISPSPTISDHRSPYSQVKRLAAPHTCPPSHTGDYASCDHTATTNDTRRASLAPDSTREAVMSSNPISHLPHWQAARLAVLLDALDGMMISDSEHVSLTWLAGFETHTVENIAAVITRARQSAPAQQ